MESLSSAETTAYGHGVEDVAFHTSLPSLHGQADTLMDATLGHLDSFLRLSTPSSPYLGPWEPPRPVQRFMLEEQESVFFNPDLAVFKMEQTSQALLARPNMGIPPVPPLSYEHCHRLASPISSTDHHSSISGTDDHLLPGTPPDTVLLSPWQQSLNFDRWKTSSAHALQFGSMGPASPADAFVNPHDINAGDAQMDWGESESKCNSTDLSLKNHTATTMMYDYDFPVHDPNIMGTYDLLDTSVGRALTGPDEDTEALVKNEGRASTGVNPPLAPAAEEEAERGKSHQEESQQRLGPKRKYSGDDDKGDYTPGNQVQRSGPSSHTRRNSRRVATPKPVGTSARASHVGKSQAVPPTAPQGSISQSLLACSECNAGKFEDQAMLDAHVKKQHTRPFHCVFHFAGCSSTFASKNEWKRHVTCQHLLLHYWLCEEDSCAKQSNSASASQAASPCSGPGSRRSRAAWHATSSSATIPPPNLPEGVWFNRKDLYTQHLRRMHMPPPVKKLLQEAKKSSSSTMASSSASASLSQPVATAPATADPVQEWDFRVKQLQESAKRTRCRLPNEMRCPAVAAGCTEAFSGAEAWDQRMEHVARHLERAAGGEEAAVVFGSGHDTSLLRWAARPDVAVVRLATAEERAAGAQVWLMNDPLQMRVGPEGLDAVGPTSKGDTMGLESGVVAELCVRLSDADRDAEGDSDEDY